MATLPIYNTLVEKNRMFKMSKSHQGNKIDTIKKFDAWYDEFWDKRGARDWESFQGVFILSTWLVPIKDQKCF
jgi:hypothetical protein